MAKQRQQESTPKSRIAERVANVDIKITHRSSSTGKFIGQKVTRSAPTPRLEAFASKFRNKK